ncbi:crossover junction endodeoxyribonuclease RuvC [candidate division KSB1 bacterium]|nr:crossover junction endodeoxyribonuclease RuvC [candidate division KSB1 bacterium]
MPELIMGIDPGSRITGYGFVQIERNNTLRFLACGCVRTRSKEMFHQRIHYIYNEITRLIREYNPDQVALEDIFYSRNIRSALQLGQARASAILAALNLGKEIATFTPREIKLALTGNGAAAKEQVQYMVLQLLGIQRRDLPLDASDALAVAICGGHRRK